HRSAPCAPPCPSTTLFRSDEGKRIARGFAARPVERYAKCRQLAGVEHDVHASHSFSGFFDAEENAGPAFARAAEPCEEAQILIRSEEHTSELQSPYDLVCR